MPQDAEVVDGDDERRTGRDGRAERRAVEDVETRRCATQPVRVPERVAAERCEAPRAAGLEPHEVEIRPPAELGQQPAHMTRSPRAGLDERRDVDPDPHAAALRTISFGSG